MSAIPCGIIHALLYMYMYLPSIYTLTGADFVYFRVTSIQKNINKSWKTEPSIYIRVYCTIIKKNTKYHKINSHYIPNHSSFILNFVLYNYFDLYGTYSCIRRHTHPFLECLENMSSYSLCAPLTFCRKTIHSIFKLHLSEFFRKHPR